MRTIKRFLFKFPEFLLIASTIFYWVSTGTLLNPIAISLVIVLILQIFLRNDFLGVVIPILLIMASIYLLLALFSEYAEFTVKNANSSRILIIGLIFILSTITASGLMIRKYTREE